MFSTDPAAAFAHSAAALRPGGRVALLCAAEPEGYQWLSALATLHDLLPTAGFGKPGAPACSRRRQPARRPHCCGRPGCGTYGANTSRPTAAGWLLTDTAPDDA
ncbi:hypothetical protein [Streptomyces sp. 900105245]